MPTLLHHLLLQRAQQSPHAKAIGCKDTWLTYQELATSCVQASQSLSVLNVVQGQRIAVYLPKTIEAVLSYFSVSLCGGIFVPVNPILKSRQVSHILHDCNANILITNQARFASFTATEIDTLNHVILIDGDSQQLADVTIWSWHDFMALHLDNKQSLPQLIATDIAAIFYTSGSTGNPKGVVLSHLNLVTGANSVSAYLPCATSDKMLAVLPFSFDYGFSQLTIAFSVGASCYLVEYVFPQELFKVILQQKITTLALVPPLWITLANCQWPEQVGHQIRYFCNTGGSMPTTTLTTLRQLMPNALPYLMYGLTEAFRSCYLPPEEIDNRPTSFGRAIPNARIMVVNENGIECAPHEHGELVHCGPLVSQGYWNDPQKTQQRFKNAPHRLNELTLPEPAVWSGDMVKKDEDGFLYFVGRKDDMIKTSGYRVSPQEVEDTLYHIEEIKEVVIIGVPHQTLGQALIAIVIPQKKNTSAQDISRQSRELLPNYMLPAQVILTDTLPRNSNGKFERGYWQSKYKNIFLAGKE
jgi:acyl-CoA ligase (AMP-forming) (exosortase A-associated)